jgi:IS4 transposase
MAFAQLTYRESLRDIEACLRTKSKKLYHLGIRGKVSRSTLADANDKRDWRIYQDFAMVLIEQARLLYSNDTFSVRLKRAAYALDSTTSDLCLSLFPWAKFRSTKAAVKLHTLLDLRGSIPSVIVISCGKMHDVNILDELVFEPGAIYIMDRGYLDFARLFRITQASAFFVTRSKKNTQFRRLYSREVNRSTGVSADQIITLTGVKSCKDYPEKLRRVVYRDPTTNKRLVFLTNNFSLAAKTIADLYKSRWQIELFFKWIKQHLRIKAFFGTSENAVHTQIWIAVSIYVLVAIIRKRLGLNHSLYTVLQILSVSTFEKTPILRLFRDVDDSNEDLDNPNQLKLF